MFFIRQFPHLEDLELYLSLVYALEKPGYWTLAPPFVHPSRGRLRISCTAGDGLAEAMVHAFGRVRFRHLDLFYTDGGQLLLDACADTLETLHLCATGLRGEKLCSKGHTSPNRRFYRHSLPSVLRSAAKHVSPGTQHLGAVPHCGIEVSLTIHHHPFPLNHQVTCILHGRRRLPGAQFLPFRIRWGYAGRVRGRIRLVRETIRPVP